MPLRLEFLGGFRAFVGQKPAGRPLTERQQQIIAYLALQRPSPVPRQKLAGLLWPESNESQARTNLRRELHHLRQTVPEIEAALEIGTRTLGWRAAARLTIDIDDFRQAADEGLRGQRDRLEAAAALYRGDLLPDSHDDWLGAERDRMRARAVEVLAALVAALDRDRSFAAAIDHAQRLLQIDPLHEETWRALMRCHARRGDRATALSVYQRCVAVLKQQVGAPPEAATQLAYREILERDDRSAAPLPARPPRPSTYPLLGRRDQFALLLDAWAQAETGRTRLAVVRGEAGIGKTRLAEELVTWAASSGLRSMTARCYAGEGRLAYAPITAWLRAPDMQPALDSLDPARLSEISRLHPELLVSRPDVSPPAPQLETWQRPRFFDALTKVFHAAAPLLLVADDLQWCDSESLEWLHYLFRSSPGFRCLVVGTVRAEEAPDNPALAPFLHDLDRDDRLITIDLGPLDETATAQLAEEAAERRFDAAARARLFRQTEGHPLHIVERARIGMTGVETSDAALPPRVQAVVVARLVQLPADAREVAELAAVVGRDFAFDVLAHASDLEEAVLVRSVDELWRRHIVRAHDAGRWDFSHDRIREVAYANIGPARRRLLHRRVAQALQHLAGSDPDRVAATIAAHFERAGLHGRAIEWFERAAHMAARLSAHDEAIRCATLGLALLEHLPSGRERDREELALRSALAYSLTPARGYAAIETEQNLERVAALEVADRGSIPLRWLWSLCALRFVRGDLLTAGRLAEDALAQAADDDGSQCEAHHWRAGALASLGDLDGARRHFEIAIARYDDARPQASALGPDVGVFAHAWYSHVLCLTGLHEDARAHAKRAVELAVRLDSPYSQAVAYAYGALTHQLLRDVSAVRTHSETLASLCDRHGFAYYSEWALILLGWVACHEGRYADGVALIDTGLARLDTQHAHARRPYYMSLLAEGCAAAGDTGRAVEALDTAIALATERHELWCMPELERLARTLPRTVRERSPA